MILDALVSFTALGVPLSLVAGDGVATASSVIDLLGQGVGTAPANIIGNRALFGEDAGIGGKRAQVEVLVAVAGVTGNSATLNVAFQASADTAVTYQPAAWTTLVETGPIAVGLLTLGQILARFDFPPAFPANLNPRYLRLLFSPAAATHFTALSVMAPVTMVRDDQANRYMSNNYAVA